MEKRYLPFLILFLFIISFVAGCTTPVAQPTGASPGLGTAEVSQTHLSTTPSRFSLNVDSLSPGSILPDVYTCKGASESPEVSWENIPSGTKSLVLILDDPDAPVGPFTHWIVYNIPPVSTGLSRAQPNAKTLADGSQQGENSAGSRGFYPPCPPITKTHHYVFHLYAVDMDIVQPAADRESVDMALNGHTLAKTEVTTLFGR